MKKLLLAMIASVFALSSITSFAAETPAKKKKQTKLGLYLTPSEANQMKTKGGKDVLFVDIRTPGELEFIGYASGTDKNIPWEFRNYKKFDTKKKRYGTDKNGQFVSDINKLVKAKGLDKDSEIILICRSGVRSAKASNKLADNGYTKVYTVTSGVQGGKNKKDHKKRNKEGWIYDNQPWSWKLTPEIMYFN